MTAADPFAGQRLDGRVPVVTGSTQGPGRAIAERFGRLDGPVDAAGPSSRATLDDTSVEPWHRLLAVNPRAPFPLMQAAVRLMRRRGDAEAGA